MGDWQPSRPRASFSKRLGNTVRRGTPAIVWLLAVLGLVMLGGTLPRTNLMPGLVDSASAAVSAPVDGRLRAVLVTLHQEVEAGQVLAHLDDSDVRLRLTQATYELERLRADMARETADLEQQARTATSEHGLETGIEQRRLISTVESAQLDALSTRTSLEEARVRVQGAVVEADRLSDLVERGVVGEPELVRVRTERDALHKRISELEGLYREHQLRIATAQRRVTEFAPGGVESLPVEAALAPMRWRLKAQEAALERIALDASLLVLAAPMRGRIASLTAQAGEWVAAGRAVVSVVDPTPRRILAYVPDAMRAGLTTDRPVEVMRENHTRLGDAAIQSISPTAVRVPERLWRVPRQEEWAFEVVVAATGFELPGERVTLGFAR